MEKYNTIVGLSFGKGSANKYLAEVIREIKKGYPGAQIIVQQDIYDWGQEILPSCRMVIGEHKEKGKYLDTFECLRQVKEFLGKETIILVCHPFHLPRAIKIAEKLGFKVVEGRVSMSIPCDPKDSQVWCRNKLFFSIWEIGAYIKYYLWNKQNKTKKMSI